MHRNKAASADFAQFLGCLRAFGRGRDAEEFARELLTPAEIEDFALRWRLLKMLRGGVPQRKIAAELGISLCKITRGSRILKKSGSQVEKVLRRIK